jgi:hypothetical protein
MMFNFVVPKDRRRKNKRNSADERAAAFTDSLYRPLQPLYMYVQYSMVALLLHCGKVTCYDASSRSHRLPSALKSD